MKLNNKGFAISSIMYIILVLAVILISLILVTLSSRKLILDKLKSEVLTAIYESPNITYRQTINELKNETIAYMTTNSLEKESIKVENLDSSIDNEVLEKYKLNDKYLTAVQNDTSYSVYLGKTITISNTTELPKNTLDIVDYKIYGNSTQKTTTQGKNLFDISKVTNVTNVTNNGDSLTIHSYGAPLKETLSELCPNLKVGDTVVLTVTPEENDGAAFIAVNGVWVTGESRTITEADLTSTVYVYNLASHVNSGGVARKLSNIQIEYGTTRTSYEPFVPDSPSINYPSEVKSVGEKTKNLFDINNLSAGNNSNYTVKDNTIEVVYTTSNNSFAFSYWLDVEPNTDYTISLTSSTLIHVFFYTDMLYGTEITSKNIESRIATFNPGENSRILIGFYGSGARGTDVISNIQIEKGTEATEYEPYGYKIPVKTSGKNLFNINQVESKTDFVVENDAITITKAVGVDAYTRTSVTPEMFLEMTGLKEGDKIITSLIKEVINGTETNTTGRIQFSGKNGTVNWNLTTNGNKLLTTVPENFNSDNYGIMIFFGCSNGESGNVITKLSNIIIAKEEMYDEKYESYAKPTTTNIYINEPLRKIEGDIDYEHFVSQKIVRKVGTKTFNGTETLGLHPSSKLNPNGINTYLWYGINDEYSDDKFDEDMPIMSTHFRSLLNSTVSTVMESGAKLSRPSDDRRILYIADVSLDVASFKNFLLNQYEHGTPVMFYYQFASQKEQIMELPKINTSIGATQISIDTSIAPSSYEFTVVQKIIEI